MEKDERKRSIMCDDARENEKKKKNGASCVMTHARLDELHREGTQ